MWGLSGRPHTPSDITLSKNIFVVYYNFVDYVLKPDERYPITLYRSERSKNTDRKVYISPIHITKNIEWKDKIKVLSDASALTVNDCPKRIVSADMSALSTRGLQT